MTGTKDEIDWSHVAPEFKCMARDEDDTVYVFENVPGRPVDGDVWYRTTGKMAEANAFASYKPGTCNWRDSLVRRPE